MCQQRVTYQSHMRVTCDVSTRIHEHILQVNEHIFMRFADAMKARVQFYHFLTPKLNTAYLIYFTFVLGFRKILVEEQQKE